MRVPSYLLAAALACALPASADDGFSIGHRKIGDDGKPAAAQPMTWRYKMLQPAFETFDRMAPEHAPGASLAFVLPKTQAGDGVYKVELVQGAEHRELPLVDPTTFTLPRDGGGDARVVVNRDFPPGEMNYPNVRVRSPDVPQGARRLGDLRVACAAQMAITKNEEDLKARAVFGMASLLFGVNPCGKVRASEIDAPRSRYDTVTVEDGQRRVVRKAGDDKRLPRIGDPAWSDRTLIRYSLDGKPVE